MNPIPLPNLRTKPAWIVGRDSNGHPLILAGKMKRPDTLSWSAAGDGSQLFLQGLWRGAPHYGEILVDAEAFEKLLASGGFDRDLEDLRRARAAWKGTT